MSRRFRMQESVSYAEGWHQEQCGDCAFFVRLTGAFASDYGACTNPRSHGDGLVRFEHDGCEVHVKSAEGW